MQVLDQQVAPARRVAEQRLHFGGGLRVDRPLGRIAARRTRARVRKAWMGMTGAFIEMEVLGASDSAA